MKHTNKKGFTIVELVIVIAVIAILAAVLIPTFSNLIKKANLSADQQAVRQMNTVLAAEQDLGADIDRVIDVLAENGYNSKGALIPVSTGYAFFYYADAKCIVLVNTEKSEVVYPADIEFVAEGEKAFNLEGSAKYIDVLASDVDTVKQALTAGSEKVVLSGETMEFNFAARIEAGKKTSIDLGDVILTTTQNAVDATKHYYGFDVLGTLELNNGTIKARGVETVAAGAKLTIGENVTIDCVDTNGGACVWNVAGAEVTINGGVFNALLGDCDDANDAAGEKEPGVINNSGKATIKGGTFTAKSNCYLFVNTGTATIDGGNFTASRGVIAAADGTVTITGGTFATEEGAAAHVLYAANGTIVVSAGVELIGDSIFALESNKEGKTYNGSITLKAGVIYNGVELAEDYVITQENQASVRITLNDLVAAQ